MTNERGGAVPRSPLVSAVDLMTHIPMGVALVVPGELVLPTNAEIQMPESLMPEPVYEKPIWAANPHKTRPM